MGDRLQIPACSLKKVELSIKHTKNKLSLVTEVDEPKTSSLVKPRRWNNFIVKFQNLKHKLLSSEPTKRKLMWKITQNKLNQTFSPEKFETKAIKISVLCC